MHKPNPVLVQATRSGMVETRFRGSVAVVDSTGKAWMAVGDVDAPVYPRSALKYFQILPLIASGAADHFGFTDREIAVMCASHNAEDAHIACVEGIFAKIGIDAGHLRCGPHRPLGLQAADQLVFAGKAPTDLHNNCSGKHAGFLALAQFHGAPLSGYLDLDHPVQVNVRQAISLCSGLPETALHAGIDGCSAPNYAFPLHNLALAMAQLVDPQNLPPAYAAACARVVRAVTSHPFYVAGTDRYCTDLMHAAKGAVVGKLGADGVYVLGIPALGLGIAIKMDDGATGPQYQVAQWLLEQLGVLDDAARQSLRPYLQPEIRNCNGNLVGEKSVVPDGFGELPPALFAQ